MGKWDRIDAIIGKPAVDPRQTAADAIARVNSETADAIAKLQAQADRLRKLSN